MLGHWPQLKPLTKKSASSHLSCVLPDQSKHKLSSIVTGFQKLDFQQVNLTLDTPVKVITCLLIQVKGLDTTSPSYTGVDT